MPELPEVETVVRDLRRGGLAGRRIVSVVVRWPRTVAVPGVRTFRDGLRGQCIAAVARRGKFITLALDRGAVLIHLRMTGRLSFANADEPRGPHQHIVLGLDDGRELRFQDTRKFGRWYFVADPAPLLARLGPEPLDRRFTIDVLTAQLRGHARMLKPLLLDQAIVAGLGNIYVDEALWEARLHPQRAASSLAAADIARLHSAIRLVLRRGIAAMGTTLGSGAANFMSVAGRRGRNQDGLKVFRRTGDPCPRCGAVVVRLVVAQRSTHLCPRCQRPD